MSGVLVDLDAEQALVGAVLQDDGLWLQVGHLRAEDFGTTALCSAWDAMRRLKSRSEGVDVVTVVDELRAMGRLESSAAVADIMALVQRVPRTAHPVEYAATVRTLSLKRQVQARAQALVHDAHDPNLSAEQLLAKAQGGFQGLSSGTVDEHGDVDLFETLDRWDAWQAAPDGSALAYLPHCLGGITEEISPGYPMSLSAIGGKEGEGKTTMAASEAARWLFRLKLAGGIIGLEDGTGWLVERMIAELLSIPFGRVGSCRLNEYQQELLSEAAARWQPVLREKLRRWPQGNMRSPELVAKVKQWKEWGARWVLVDHGLRVRYESETQRARYDMAINETMNELAELARPRREHPGMAIIVCWHLNREIPPGTMPTKDHFKEGGYLGSNCRYMPAIWMDKSRPGFRMVTCTKANRGPPDWTVAVRINEEACMLSATDGYLVDFQAEREKAAEDAREAKESSRKRMKLFPGGAE